MKIYLLLLVVFGFIALIIVALNNPQPRLTIDAKQMPLPTLLDTMQVAYQLNWYVEDDSIEQYMLPVTYKAKHATMKEMLRALERLEPGLTFQVTNIGPFQSLLVKVKTPPAAQ